MKKEDPQEPSNSHQPAASQGEGPLGAEQYRHPQGPPQALIRELLAASAPFLASCDRVQATYGRAIREASFRLRRFREGKRG